MTRQFRFVHIGVAAALVAAAMAAIGLAKDVGAAGTASPSVFVPIVPCRLLDTRLGSTVGTRSTPLAGAEVATFAVWGTNGNCTIPATATGIATNVTAVNPSSASYVTIYPTDAVARPTASNLNVVAGGAPTPNQVTVGLSAAGAINAYNNGGTLDLVVDIVGYYQPATTGIGAQGPQGPMGPQGVAGPTCPAAGCSLVLLGTDSVATDGSFSFDSFGCRNVAANTVTYLPISLPLGAKITATSVRYNDTNGGQSAFDLWVVTVPGSNRLDLTFNSTLSINGQLTGDLVFTTPPPPVGPTAEPYIGISVISATQKFCGATVTYTF